MANALFRLFNWLFPDDTEKHERIALNLLSQEGLVTPTEPHLIRAFERLAARGECRREGNTYHLATCARSQAPSRTLPRLFRRKPYVIRDDEGLVVSKHTSLEDADARMIKSPRGEDHWTVDYEP